LTFAIASRDADLALTIAGSLGRFWVFRGHEPEGLAWLQAALDLPQATHDQARFAALYWGTIFAEGQRDKTGALALAKEALALAQELRNSDFVISASHELIRRFLDAGEIERAKQLIGELMQFVAEHGDDPAMAICASIDGQILLYEGRPTAAAARLEQSVAAARRSGDIHLVEGGLVVLALAQAILGRSTECRASLRESVNLLARLRFPNHVAECLQAAAQLALAEDDPSHAAASLVRADGLLPKASTTATGVEGALYNRTWSHVREHVSTAEVEDLRLTLPLGDLDEALDYVSRYLA
jgi:hypothetical protein